jgi:hypothetical protein
MTRTVRENPVTSDKITGGTPRPRSAGDPFAFSTRLPARAAVNSQHRHAQLAKTFAVPSGTVLSPIGASDLRLASDQSVFVLSGPPIGLWRALLRMPAALALV